MYVNDAPAIFGGPASLGAHMTRDESGKATGASRRNVLKALGVAGVLAGTGGVAAGQETTETTAEGTRETTGATTTGGEVAGTPIILGGEVEHWYGLAPSAIHGEENPTLSLREGERYTVIWINLDGAEHEFIIEDANGEELAATESAETPGETRSVTFTASPEMAEYYCEYHPQAMRGQVETGGFETETAGTETTAAGTTVAERDEGGTY